MRILFISSMIPKPVTERVSVPCIRALREMGHEVAHAGPNDLSYPEWKKSRELLSKLGDVDLVICIEDAIPDDIELVSVKKVFWGIEDFHHWRRQKRFKNVFDFCFTAFEPCAKQFDIHYLPYAVSDKIFEMGEEEKTEDITFVGRRDYNYYAERMRYLDALRKEIKVCWHPQNNNFATYIKLLSQGKIIWNYDVFSHMGERIFEAVSLGFHLCNRVVGVENLFEDGKHLILYDKIDDMIEKALYYLDHEEERRRIERAGILLMKEKHTYKNRMLEMLRIVTE